MADDPWAQNVPPIFAQPKQSPKPAPGASGDAKPPSTAFGGGKATPETVFGGGKQPTNVFGGAKQPTNVFGGAKQPTNVFGGAKQPTNVFGGGKQTPETVFGGAKAAPTPVTKSDVQNQPTTSSTAGASGAAKPAPFPGNMSSLNETLQNRLVDIQANVQVTRSDPNSVLYSAKTFESLHLNPDILKGVYEMGFDKPSKIQETTLPLLLADPPTNMIAQSQSGTGKTAAFVLCMLSRINLADPYPQAVCFSPTYELALQTAEIVEKMGQYMTGLKVIKGVKGQERYARGTQIQGQIIVGTPGTMLDYFAKLKLLDVSKIKVCAFDEADVMISISGHQDQSVRVQQLLPRSCQMLLFSATYDEAVIKFAQQVVKNPTVLRLKIEEQCLDNIKQVYFTCRDRNAKFEAIYQLYSFLSVGQTMVFCRTREGANWLAAKLVEKEFKVALLTGELDVTQREAVINRFRTGTERVLISTNVSARGLDIAKVTVVINFDLPVTMNGHPDFDTYIHRIGRTGRFGKAGLAVNLVDTDASKSVLDAIADHFQRPIEFLQNNQVASLAFDQP